MKIHFSLPWLFMLFVLLNGPKICVAAEEQEGVLKSVTEHQISLLEYGKDPKYQAPVVHVFILNPLTKFLNFKELDDLTPGDKLVIKYDKLMGEKIAGSIFVKTHPIKMRSYLSEKLYLNTLQGFIKILSLTDPAFMKIQGRFEGYWTLAMDSYETNVWKQKQKAGLKDLKIGQLVDVNYQAQEDGLYNALSIDILCEPGECEEEVPAADAPEFEKANAPEK